MVNGWGLAPVLWPQTLGQSQPSSGTASHHEGMGGLWMATPEFVSAWPL